MPFKHGDVVKLNSGGPDMIVVGIRATVVICQWLDGGRRVAGPFAPETICLASTWHALRKLVWTTAPVDCDVCGHEWVGVWPEGIERVECPGCGFFTLAPPVALIYDCPGDDDDDGEACPA